MTELADKSGTKSVVWGYFGIEVGADGKLVDNGSAVCWNCLKRVMAKDGTILNLLAYLWQVWKGKQLARKATLGPPMSSHRMLQESVMMRVA